MPTLNDIIKGASDLLEQKSSGQMFGKVDNSTVRLAERQLGDLVAQGTKRIADLKQRREDTAAALDRAIADEESVVQRLKAQMAATTQPPPANAAEPAKPAADAKPKRKRKSTK